MPPVFIKPLLNLIIWPSNRIFSLLSVIRDGESMCETKEQ